MQVSLISLSHEPVYPILACTEWTHSVNSLWTSAQSIFLMHVKEELITVWSTEPKSYARDIMISVKKLKTIKHDLMLNDICCISLTPS